MKTCFKCHQSKPLNEYYKHPQMGDGHLGKCKDCTRKDVADRVALKSAVDLAWVLSERERHRLKAERHRNEGRPKKQRSEPKAEWCKRNPEKKAAATLLAGAIKSGRLQRQPCEKCGAKAQAHHDDYAKPLDVRWLCPKHHGEHHRQQREAEIIAKFQPR